MTFWIDFKKSVISSLQVASTCTGRIHHDCYITTLISKEHYLNSIPFKSRDNLKLIIASFQKICEMWMLLFPTVFRNYWTIGKVHYRYLLTKCTRTIGNKNIALNSELDEIRFMTEMMTMMMIIQDGKWTRCCTIVRTHNHVIFSLSSTATIFFRNI